MRALLAALLLLAAQEALPEPPRPAVPPTRMGRELLSVCPLVAVGRTIAVRRAGVGTELLSVRLLERLLGDAWKPGDVVSVLIPAGQFPFGSEDLLFLRPWRGDERFEVLRRIAATDAHFEPKLALTRRHVWLMEIADEEQRADATLSLVLDLLRSPDAWTRSQGLDELRWMAESLPALFTPARRERVVAAARACPDAQVGAGILAVDAGLHAAGPTEQSPP